MSIFNTFRSVRTLNDLSSISKRLDEPTYLSFRLQFASDMDDLYNKASNATANYDTMPHPLFDIRDYVGTNLTGFLDNVQPENEPQSYSTYKYLIDANEPTRAEMLLEFIDNFNQIQSKFPYYFQSITGLNELLKPNFTRGYRVKDSRLVISVLESLDLRMSHLLNLYKKIAWDEVYQRWILPDMMRFFTLKIYISEFRTFHTSVQYSSDERATPQEVPLFLKVLDNILPVWEITCEMCEFDIESSGIPRINEMNVTEPGDFTTLDLVIKVGNIKEVQLYPTFKNMYLSDRKLNGPNRAKDEISTVYDSNKRYIYPAITQIAQAREYENSNIDHMSTAPYNQTANDKTLFGQNPLGADGVWGTPDDNIVSPDPTKPETWVGNAITWGKAFAENELNKLIDKAKISTIQPLGLSLNEITTAIESKNIVSALGFVRKGINEVVNAYTIQPSSLLGGSAETDVIFQNFVENIAKSTATDPETSFLRTGASEALSNPVLMERIKDFSMATDLVSDGEINIQNKPQYSTVNRPEIMFKAIEQHDVINILPSSLLNNTI